MRPISIQRSVVRYPLDEALGSEAQLRLIRALVYDVEAPLSVADAARLSGITSAGARKALKRIEESGLIERIGSGRAQKWGLKKDQTIMVALRRLFDEERQRYDSFISRLRQAVELPEVRAAWIEQLPKRASEPAQISVVVEVRAITWMQDELRSHLIKLEKEFNLIIEVNVFTRADAPRPCHDAVLLKGTETIYEQGFRKPMQTHAEADQRSLLMAKIISELIRSDPSLITRAMQHLNRLIHEGQGTANADIAEWRQVLETYSSERLRDFLVSTSSRAERLRQSSPFFAVLTPSERDRLVSEIERRS